MIELLINDDPIYTKIAIDGEKYLVYYGDYDGLPAEFNRKASQGCRFEKYIPR